MLSGIIILLPLTASAFVSPIQNANALLSVARLERTFVSQHPSDCPPSVDVSDLNLTMEDLRKPLPPELLQSLRSTGYESTNRLIDDEGCQWTESLESVNVELQIPGLRGQPSAAMAVLFSKTTMSVSVFGRVVWSAILRGTIDPDLCSFESADGVGMVPVLRLNVRKATGEWWGGFILQIGEDSLV
jgi:hypothetical protein